MASNTLSGTGNTPANTKDQLIHIGTGTVGGTYTLRLGDGTTLPVDMTPTGIGVETLQLGGATKITLSSLATGGGAVAIADASGTLFPEVVKLLAATTNTPTATTTAIALTDFDFTPDANGVYSFDGLFLVRSNNTAVGYTLALSGPTLAVCGLHCVVYGADGAVIADEVVTALTSGTPANLAVRTSVPAANQVYLVRVTGFYKVSGVTGLVRLSLTASANTAASFVTMEAASMVHHIKRG
jgi:hypothetical protein